MNRSSLLLASFASLLGLAVACGGKTISDDPSSSSQSQVRGENDDGNGGGTTSGIPATPGSSCVYAGMGGGSSGGGGPTYSCMVAHDYTCASEDQRITCECIAPTGGTWADGTGSCTCGDLTFPIDCSNACSGIPASAYAQCGLPAPPPSSSSSGGSSSSSGGS